MGRCCADLAGQRSSRQRWLGRGTGPRLGPPASAALRRSASHCWQAGPRHHGALPAAGAGYALAALHGQRWLWKSL